MSKITPIVYFKINEIKNRIDWSVLELNMCLDTMKSIVMLHVLLKKKNEVYKFNDIFYN